VDFLMPAEALAKYKDMAPAAFKGHSAVIRASHGRKEVLEGPAAEEILIGCSANWLRNQTMHSAFTAPVFLVAGTSVTSSNEPRKVGARGPIIRCAFRN
jgi:hypothetical protein